ncbi:hypothetical protein B484DRAFT_408638 [Ochromonadaceae sp. CCMP2298]|nr:hypothetical protein B484DRAFT_408638 [Ochromonadaceae sp. CCMP2298]
MCLDFERFRRAITAKHHAQFPGEALPADAVRCALFGDGSRFEGIYGPDGIFYDWYDEPLGRDSDQYFMRNSNVNAILRGIAAALGMDHWIYLDKGYAASSHTRCAAHGPAPVSVQQRPHLLKLQAMDVALHIRVAVLLTNAHTCIEASQSNKYFNCPAPSLEQYFTPPL